jgi:prepilin-type N-terminal cleavage/methylation domain-containing protein
VTSERNHHGRGGACERRRPASGFTLIELMVIVAIIAILAGLAFSNYARTRPRVRLSTTAAEIQTALMVARQEAIGRSRDVAVLFFPNQVTSSGTGRVVVYLDAAGGFMNGAPPAGFPSFCSFNRVTMAGGSSSTGSGVLSIIDLPGEVRIGPPTSAVAVAFPFNTVPATVTGCSFCDNALDAGAIRFDARGRATVYSTCGPLDLVAGVNGGSITLVAAEITGTYMVVVSPTGNVRTFNAG